MQDGHNVFGVHRVHTPLCLPPLESQHMIGEAEHYVELAPLSLLRLGHFRHLELLPCQVLHQLLEDLKLEKKNQVFKEDKSQHLTKSFR